MFGSSWKIFFNKVYSEDYPNVSKGDKPQKTDWENEEVDLFVCVSASIMENKPKLKGHHKQ